MGILFEVSGKGKSENTVPGKHRPPENTVPGKQLPRLYEGGWRRERTRIPAKANSGEMVGGRFRVRRGEGAASFGQTLARAGGEIKFDAGY